MALVILRCVFMVVAVGIGSILIKLSIDSGGSAWLPWLAILGTTSLAGAVIAADIFLPRKQIDIISGVYFGLLVGVLLTYVFTLALQPLFPESTDKVDKVKVGVELVLGMVL